jgi:hypothetical protein
MPNWCNNNLTITADAATLDKIEAAFLAGELLSFLCPQPDYEGYMDSEIKHDRENIMPDWWCWRVENWGTKWDISPRDADFQRDGDKIWLSFDSAWSPPCKALFTSGLVFSLTYFEGGVGFCGEAYRLDNGDEFEETYDLDETPEHLRAEFEGYFWGEVQE